MKKKNLWIIILVVLLTIGILISLVVIQKRRDARPFNTYDFPQTLVVSNSTNYDRADTLCLYLAHQILGLDTMELMIVYIPEHINSGEMEFYGMIQQIPFGKNQFLILLNKDRVSLTRLKEILSHEFVHMDQYISGDLKLYPGFAIYKGEDVYFGETEYEDRPFEKEAFALQGKFVKKLNKFLYD